MNVSSSIDERSIDFNIPAQPLATALDEYAVLSGRPAVFRSALVAGRTSSAVQGRYPAEIGLRLLLRGTGLLSDEVGGGKLDAFVLKSAGENAPVATVPVPSAIDDLMAYDGLVQAHIWEAFCEDPRTTPGSFRALLRFGVDASGRIQRARLLGSSGDKGRDAALLEILHRIDVDQAPPQGMPQPLTMLVLPRGQIAGQSCARSH
ncbi:energy transducer TonB family protein [Variovorax boronicumulans]